MLHASKQMPHPECSSACNTVSKFVSSRSLFRTPVTRDKSVHCPWKTLYSEPYERGVPQNAESLRFVDPEKAPRRLLEISRSGFTLTIQKARRRSTTNANPFDQHQQSLESRTNKESHLFSTCVLFFSPCLDVVAQRLQFQSQRLDLFGLLRQHALDFNLLPAVQRRLALG